MIGSIAEYVKIFFDNTVCEFEDCFILECKNNYISFKTKYDKKLTFSGPYLIKWKPL